MTDSKCSRCEGWFDPDEHDFAHLRERTVEALERIADALEKAPQVVSYSVMTPDLRPTRTSA